MKDSFECEIDGYKIVVKTCNNDWIRRYLSILGRPRPPSVGNYDCVSLEVGKSGSKKLAFVTNPEATRFALSLLRTVLYNRGIVLDDTDVSCAALVTEWLAKELRESGAIDEQ